MRTTLITRLTTRWRELTPGLRLSLQLFVFTRILLTVFSVGSAKLIGHYDGSSQIAAGPDPAFSGNPLLDAWAHWDSAWYLHIVQHGYTGAQINGGQMDIAFFPLFPQLVRLLSWPFGFNATAALVIGLLISSVSLVIAGYLLYRLVKQKFGATAAKWSVILLYVSPMGFVLSAFMTEGLFLALTLLALVWAQERKWLRVAPVLTLLVLTRSVGGLVAIALLLQYVMQNKWSLARMWRLESLWVLGPVVGVAILFVINFLVTHDPIAFIHTEAAWGRQLFKLDSPSGGLFTLQGLYLAFFGVSSLALVTIYRNVIGLPYFVLGLLLVLVPASSALYGLVRYTAIIVPLYIILGYLAAKHPKLQTPLLVGMALLQGVHLVWWAVGMPIMQ